MQTVDSQFGIFLLLFSCLAAGIMLSAIFMFCIYFSINMVEAALEWFRFVYHTLAVDLFRLRARIFPNTKGH